jgi:hypothetical protein
MIVFAQSDRKKNPTPINVRAMTRNEILAIPSQWGRSFDFLLTNGRLGQVRSNGAIKTWKREPDRFEIPVKYGMYECARLSLPEALSRFVIIED